jgi:HSP20 family molecular chaperone IbpA
VTKSPKEGKKMADTESKELRHQEKQELQGAAEQTRPGYVFTPSVDIFETDLAITMLADMPGVDSENLTIDLRDNALTIIGELSESVSDSEVTIYKEYETGKYYRQFSLSNEIDQDKIDAKLKDGVLRLELPKVEKAKPRQINVQAG